MTSVRTVVPRSVSRKNLSIAAGSYFAAATILKKRTIKTPDAWGDGRDSLGPQSRDLSLANASHARIRPYANRIRRPKACETVPAAVVVLAALGVSMLIQGLR